MEMKLVQLPQAWAVRITNFTIGKNIPAGEYQLEAVAEDANGLISRAHRQAIFIKSNPGTIELTSPAQGTVLEKGSLVNFAYSSTAAREAHLEINGQVAGQANWPC